MTEKTHWIGIVGKNGSGKSTLASYLSSQGYFKLSLSDFVRQEALTQGLSLTRDNLTMTGTNLKKRFGKDYLAQLSLMHAFKSQEPKIVFDSIRLPEEINALIAADVTIIGVEADLETRFSRIQDRAGDTDQVDLETFKTQDIRENSGQSDGQHIDACLDMCQIRLQNNGSLEDLYSQLHNEVKGL